MVGKLLLCCPHFPQRRCQREILTNLQKGHKSAHDNIKKQAGAELGQAQVKLEVVDEGLAKA